MEIDLDPKTWRHILHTTANNCPTVPAIKSSINVLFVFFNSRRKQYGNCMTGAEGGRVRINPCPFKSFRISKDKECMLAWIIFCSNVCMLSLYFYSMCISVFVYWWEHFKGLFTAGTAFLSTLLMQAEANTMRFLHTSTLRYILYSCVKQSNALYYSVTLTQGSHQNFLGPSHSFSPAYRSSILH